MYCSLSVPHKILEFHGLAYLPRAVEKVDLLITSSNDEVYGRRPLRELDVLSRWTLDEASASPSFRMNVGKPVNSNELLISLRIRWREVSIWIGTRRGVRTWDGRRHDYVT